MSSSKIKQKIFCIVGVVSLVAGFMIYMLFRESTYISNLVLSVLPFKLPSLQTNSLVKYYLGDYLWGVSLSAWLHVIFSPKGYGTAVCTGVVFLFGSGYEIMQYLGVIGGTGDILDAGLYLLAGLTVNIINLKKG